MPDFFHTLREIVRSRNPGWDLQLWDDEKVEGLGLPAPFKQLYDALSPVMQSDFLRYYLLYRFGGWYLDVDVESLRGFDELGQPAGCIMGWEHENSIGSAVLAAVPGHPLMYLLADTIGGSILQNQHLGIMHQSGPAFLTRTVSRAPEDLVRSIWIAHPEVFYPCRPADKPNLDAVRQKAILSGQSFTIHHWTGTWRAPEDPWRTPDSELTTH
ncbi:MAG TPA: glycosyltransferase [Kineosporiaceae bacterium]|nr:glycosyltransferase [Kineosporiaceae bacterium]